SRGVPHEEVARLLDLDGFTDNLPAVRLSATSAVAQLVLLAEADVLEALSGTLGNLGIGSQPLHVADERGQVPHAALVHRILQLDADGIPENLGQLHRPEANAGDVLGGGGDGAAGVERPEVVEVVVDVCV